MKPKKKVRKSGSEKDIAHTISDFLKSLHNQPLSMRKEFVEYIIKEMLPELYPQAYRRYEKYKDKNNNKCLLPTPNIKIPTI